MGRLFSRVAASSLVAEGVSTQQTSGLIAPFGPMTGPGGPQGPCQGAFQSADRGSGPRRRRLKTGDVETSRAVNTCHRVMFVFGLPMFQVPLGGLAWGFEPEG